MTMMNFQCRCCGALLSRSYDSDRTAGDVLGRPWYRDDTGLNHLAIVCLNCGTIHDCSGSAIRALLTLGKTKYKCHNSIDPLQLSTMVRSMTGGLTSDARTIAVEKLGIPESVVNALVERTLLGPAFDSTRTDSTVQDDGSKNLDINPVRQSSTDDLQERRRCLQMVIEESEGCLKRAHRPSDSGISIADFVENEAMNAAADWSVIESVCEDFFLEIELYCLCAFVRLLSIHKARLGPEVERAFRIAAQRHGTEVLGFPGIKGPGTFEIRANEYLAAVIDDKLSDQRETLPTLISQILLNVLGIDDSTVKADRERLCAFARTGCASGRSPTWPGRRDHPRGGGTAYRCEDQPRAGPADRSS